MSELLPSWPAFSSLHIVGSLASKLPSINREVKLLESCSCETEQLLTAARTDLLQVQTLLSTQLDEGADRLRAAQVSNVLRNIRALLSQAVELWLTMTINQDQPAFTLVIHGAQ